MNDRENMEIMDDAITKHGRGKFDYHNLIVWITAVTFILCFIIFSVPGELLAGDTVMDWIRGFDYMPDSIAFVVTFYLTTISAFIGVLLYTAFTKRNRFIYRSFLPADRKRTLKMLLMGLLVGFIMNSACIVCAILNGDIHLFLNFTIKQIPFYIFALICVFIQSSSEELWVRGFMLERINVRYPLWVAILVSSLFFGMLHIANPGATVFAIVEICVAGLSFSMTKWYTGNIWFTAGVHTAWNFTQNFIFGLPNSGLVSEASVFGLDAASAQNSLVYSVPFGVEGALPSLVVDFLVVVICLTLAAREGRINELFQTQVTPGKDPLGPQPI